MLAKTNIKRSRLSICLCKLFDDFFFCAKIYQGENMLGAIIGDLAGSIYEYDQVKACHPVKMRKILEDNAFFSDDTILTIAILDAILNKKDYGKNLRDYVAKFENYKPNFLPYFEKPFSPNFLKWSKSKESGTSRGNGAMMRISPVGFLFETEEEVIENARLATIPSHNCEESICCAKTVALIVFYGRKGLSKEDIKNKLNLEVKRPQIKSFNYTCYETLDVCLYSFFKSKSFKDALKIALSFGGDTDTNCAITGAMAEAMYGIENGLKDKVLKMLPKSFQILLKKVYKNLC